ncbi:hypothetical protein GO755_38450 [Spirosoma sp. HMF4905]|uniref:Uncharacterized protein n=1 Tax=Spirosoma arboris TaxID=2682092 RepID=A0A7K1SQ77_9BACT|nr:hypothetical protein [Spirosoma arboris]MVM35958.1 hypothetical protein [Spirosoma arboris]
MKNSLLIIAFLLAGLLGFAIYCWALIDWIQDYRTGIFARDHNEAIRDTGGILLYSYAGFRFLRSRTI